MVQEAETLQLALHSSSQLQPDPVLAAVATYGVKLQIRSYSLCLIHSLFTSQIRA